MSELLLAVMVVAVSLELAAIFLLIVLIRRELSRED